jgi:hypothetical protein
MSTNYQYSSRASNLVGNQQLLSILRNIQPESFEFNSEFEEEVTKIDENKIYQSSLVKIQTQLKRNFQSPNDPKLINRRNELKRLFSLIPSAYAKSLYDRLQTKSNQLGHLFQHRLATSTRKELLNILIHKVIVPPPTSPVQVPKVNDDSYYQMLIRNDPLPPSLEPEFQVAVRRILDVVSSQNKLSKEQTRRLICMLTKLQQKDVDDRVISWGSICSGYGLLLPTPCPIGTNKKRVADDLYQNIKSKSDVDQANEKLRFMMPLKPTILNTHRVFSHSNDAQDIEGILEVLVGIDSGIFATNYNLRIMFDDNLFPSAKPRYYLAIKDWIAEKQQDPNSVNSC